MVRLEEYIAKRKSEDKLNEFNLDAKDENLKVCVNYMYEYFNQYLDPAQLQDKTILDWEKIEKFGKQFEEYETDVQEWFVHIYDVHDMQIRKSINNLLNKEELFYLFHTENEFRSCSYDCYARLIKKNEFLKDQAELLFKYIKEYHHVQSKKREEWKYPFITEEINKWIEDTWIKYNVSI